MDEFENIIQYQFKNKQLLTEALSHSSYANEKKKTRNSNERLEFLGDSVLSVIVSQYLFEHFSHLPEGELTKIRASLVCEKSLYIAQIRLMILLLGRVKAYWRKGAHQSCYAFEIQYSGYLS